MKVIQYCRECNKEEVIGYKCEVCGKINTCEAITVNFGYRHYLDGEEYHFCGNKCIYYFFEK